LVIIYRIYRASVRVETLAINYPMRKIMTPEQDGEPNPEKQYLHSSKPIIANRPPFEMTLNTPEARQFPQCRRTSDKRILRKLTTESNKN